MAAATPLSRRPPIAPGTDLCIHQVFEAQAEKTPHRIAVAFGGLRLSYRELNERSNRVAHRLRGLGVGPNVFVGLCVERTLELVIGILGILKAGGAYVPIDPQYPLERQAFMLTDSRAPVFVTQRTLAADLGVPRSHVVLMDDDSEGISRESPANLESGARPDDLAYVIYTSGSTGQPKGTLISHRNVVRLFDATRAGFHFGEHDVWTLFHSCAFDFSVWELWGALFHGGRLIVVPFDVSRTPDRFHRLLQEEQVTVLNQTPSAFRQLVRAEENLQDMPPSALRLIILGGEALDFKSLAAWFDRHGEQPRVVNMYGITETTVHVTHRTIDGGGLDGSNVIGVPISDVRVHLLDEDRNPVAPGIPGEIYVGGAGVGRGYLNRPDLTAQKFVADPFSEVAGSRLYRSGDLARYLPNGELEYLGRIDNQVKIRGFRIELGEIAAAINSHAAVQDSVVTVGEDPAGQKILIAYLVACSAEDVDLSALRQLLRTHLPEYMMPSEFVFIERMPLTINGKLDLRSLPAPGGRGNGAAAAPPRGTSLEENIAAIWCAVLNRPHVELEQNFFDVGGNSMNLVEVHAGMQRLLGREFSITELFAHSTVRGLAAHFGAKSNAKPDARVESAAAVRARRQREAVSAWRGVRRERQ